MADETPPPVQTVPNLIQLLESRVANLERVNGNLIRVLVFIVLVGGIGLLVALTPIRNILPLQDQQTIRAANFVVIGQDRQIVGNYGRDYLNLEGDKVRFAPIDDDRWGKNAIDHLYPAHVQIVKQTNLKYNSNSTNTNGVPEWKNTGIHRVTPHP